MSVGRRLRCERLEPRRMMHADVNLDGIVSSLDALAVINNLEETPVQVGRYHNMDVNLDRRITALDALIVINQLHVTPNHVVRVKLGPIYNENIPESEVRWAISSAFQRFEEAGDVDFQYVTSGQNLTIASTQLVVRGQHVRGAYYPGVVYFHNDTGLGSATAIYNGDQLRRILQHEMGHWLGWSHSTNRSCIMEHNTAGLEWCEVELAKIANRWGVSKL